MSRIGRKPIALETQATVQISDQKVQVSGPKGTLEYSIPAGITVQTVDGQILVGRQNDEKATRALHGLVRALLSSMIEGVTKGFEKRMEIIGVGYRAQTSGNKITLSLGFSHPVIMDAPKGVSVQMHAEEKNVIIVSGADKQAVGEFAANIRKLRKPEPYKGKGIRYVGEYVPRKAGKAAGAK